jgi:hypothetical protein
MDETIDVERMVMAFPISLPPKPEWRPSSIFEFQARATPIAMPTFAYNCGDEQGGRESGRVWCGDLPADDVLVATFSARGRWVWMDDEQLVAEFAGETGGQLSAACFI